jgi:hypothetical protein
MTSDPSLPESLHTRLETINNKAITNIQSYLYNFFSSLPHSGPPLSTILEIYNSLKFSTPSPELCGICGTSIPFKNHNFGACSNNHYFRKPFPNSNTERCSITLLTLSTPFAFTCRVCKNKMIDKRAFKEDEEWCALVFPREDFDWDEIPGVQRCIYCGGEWFRSL